MSPIRPDRQYNLINIVRRIAMCMEVRKTDYIYKAMFNDRNLIRFWRCDNRIILLGLRFPSMEVEKIFFLLFSTFLPFHPSLCLPIFLPSTISYFFLSYFLPRVSSCVFPLLANNYFFHSIFPSWYRSLFLCVLLSAFIFLSVFISVLLPIFVLSRLHFQHFTRITV